MKPAHPTLEEMQKLKTAACVAPARLPNSYATRTNIHDALTPTERAVAVLVSEGKTNSEIAGTLYLAYGTVKNYVATILQKTHLTNRAALAVYAVQHDLAGQVASEYSATVQYDPDCYRDLAFLAYA